MANKFDLDVVLIHPGNRKKIYQSLGDNLTGIEPPVWAAMLATFIRNKGFSVIIVDSEADNLDSAETAKRVVGLNPRLAAVVVYGHQPSASTQNMTVAGEICSSIAESGTDIKTLLLGGHVAALPKRTLEEEDVDFVAGGEGPYTLLELLQVLKAGNRDYKNVRGLWYMDDDIVKSNPMPPLITDLEHEFPKLAWDLLPMDKYRAHNWHCFGDLNRQPYAAIYTTLGCPYHCTFCCIQAPFKAGEVAGGISEAVNTYRFWSPDSVIGQIDELVHDYGIRNLRISDEMFVLNPRHVNGICDLIIERGYDLNIWAYARVDTIRGEETTEKLKRAGFNWICLGIESANEKVRDDVEKGYRQEQIFETVDKVRSSGINIIGNYIFGLPEDDREAMQSTLDLAMDLNCEFANFYSAMAYPGSQLYDLAVEMNWPLPKQWGDYSQHAVDTLPLPTNYMSGPEVLAFRDAAWQTYFSNPKYLQLIQDKFGFETVAHINDMASHKLERNQVS